MPAAFSHDALALDLAMHGLMLAVDMEMKEVERKFFYLPLEHSERLSDQELCLKALGGAVRSARPAFKPILEDSLNWAEKHKQVITRFGRFPHRNATLGRVSTADEEAWLRENGGF